MEDFGLEESCRCGLRVGGRYAEFEGEEALVERCCVGASEENGE
jgi:hypothetical protein